MLVKVSADKVFMHYFKQMSSTLMGGGGQSPQTDAHQGAMPLNPVGDFRPQSHNLPTPGKNPAGIHAIDHDLSSLEECSFVKVHIVILDNIYQ